VLLLSNTLPEIELYQRIKKLECHFNQNKQTNKQNKLVEGKGKWELSSTSHLTPMM
jgi:hypothetical protein